MLYLIKSIKWSKHYKKDTYWGPDECGYVSIIANAGFYEEEHANKIIRLSSGNAEMIPVTKEILDKAYKQLKRVRREITKDREAAETRYKIVLNDFDRRDDAVDDGFSQLDNIAEQLGI